MSRAAERVRCYSCGRLVPRDAAGCARCSANFRALCGCGAELSIYDDECPQCGTGHVPKRCPTSKFPAVRAAKWTTACLAVAVVAWVWLAPRQLDNFGLKKAAAEAYNAGDYETAVGLLLRATANNAGDAEAWYRLALCYRALFPGEQFVEPAEHAITIAPDHFGARELLAQAEIDRGNLDRALEHAEAAARSPSATGGAWLLLARLELQRPQPNLAGVQDALERARTLGRDTTEVKAMLAEVTIRLHGALAGGVDRLPPRSAAILRTALSALESEPPRGADPATVAITRARIQLALGEGEKAIIAADAAFAALEKIPSGAPLETAAEVRLVRAMAHHARGDRVEALDQFNAVLRDRPDSITAATASAYLMSAGDPEAARALLARAADANDPRGAVHAVLATLLLQQRDVEGASRAIEAARAASPDDAFFAEIMGSVRIEQRRFGDARSAFADAIRAAPGLVGPHVRTALVVLAEEEDARGRAAVDDGKARAAARATALRDLESLRARFGDHPFLLEGIGRLDLATGDVAGARAALETAAVRWPADPDIWIALAEARRRSVSRSDADHVADAAAAWGRARVLRPDDPAIALAEAEAWAEAGRYEVAAAACTEFLRRHPDDPTVLRARALSYRGLSMWGLEAADLRKLKEMGRAGGADAVWLVEALFSAGDVKAGVKAAAEAKAMPGLSPETARRIDFHVALHGGDADAAIARLADGGPTFFLAEIQFAAGRVDDSIATLRDLARSRPGDPAVTQLLVAELLGREPVTAESLAEARALRAALAADAPPEIALLLDGRILLAEGRHADAVAPLREAAGSLPANPFAALFLGEALFRTGERSESLAILRSVLTKPTVPPSFGALVADRLLKASRESRDVEKAESLAREALRLDPRLVAAAYRAINMLRDRGEYSEAARVAEDTLQTQGLGPDVVVKLRLAAATMHLLAGKFTAVEVQVDALPAEVRDSADGRILLGFAELGAGRVEAAARVFDGLLAADAQSQVATIGLVQAALKLGNRVAAAARVDAWTAAHPDDRDVTLGASRLFFREGFADDALRLAKLGASRHPRDITVVRHLADVLRRTDDTAEARDVMRRFVEAAPPELAAQAQLAQATLAVRCGFALDEALATARRIGADPDVREPDRTEAAVLEAEALLAARKPAEAEAVARRVRDVIVGAPVRGPREEALEFRARFVIGFAAATATPPRRAQAMEEFSRCREIDPSSLDVENNIAGLMAWEPSSAAQALDYARRATAGAPENASYWSTRGEAAARAGEPEEAEKAYARSLELRLAAKQREPDRIAAAGLRAARFLRERKKPDEARAVAEKVRAALAGTGAEREIERFLAE